MFLRVVVGRHDITWKGAQRSCVDDHDTRRHGGTEPLVGFLRASVPLCVVDGVNASASIKVSRVRIFGVVDLTGGRAVHARAGRRDEYAAIERVAGTSIAPGDAVALALAYRDRFGIDELYVADLDAITGRAPQESLVAALASVGPLWLDAGIASPDAARRALDTGAARVIVGLETLTSFEALASISAAIGEEKVAFSLDLRDGRPIHPPGVLVTAMPAAAVAARAADAGVTTVILIDLARVGTGRGLDVGLLQRVRMAVPHVSLIAGGGIRGPEDVSRLAAAGCDGVLIASAIHDGRLTPADVAAARERYPSVSR
jgi:phosphoribosylformimino-5-aminoimidazole carboxamide ribotide isomerase